MKFLSAADTANDKLTKMICQLTAESAKRKEEVTDLQKAFVSLMKMKVPELKVVPPDLCKYWGKDVTMKKYTFRRDAAMPIFTKVKKYSLRRVPGSPMPKEAALPDSRSRVGAIVLTKKKLSSRRSVEQDVPEVAEAALPSNFRSPLGSDFDTCANREWAASSLGAAALCPAFAARVRDLDIDAFCDSLADDGDAEAFRRLHANLLLHVSSNPTGPTYSEFASLLNVSPA